MSLIGRRTSRPVSALAGLLVLPAALVVGLASPSSATSSTAAFASASGSSATASETYFTDHINAARAAAGVPALATASDIVSVARNWSAVMANGAGLSHNPNLQTQITNWSWLGENVGVGYSNDSLWNAFMNSPHHRDNILDRHFTQVGVGVVIAGDGNINITQDFRRPNAAPPVAAAPAPVRAPIVATAAAPAAAPALTTAPPPPDPAMLARAALVSRIAAAARTSDHADGTVQKAMGFATVMTGR